MYESKLCLNILYFLYIKNKKKPYDYFLQKSDLIKNMIKYRFYLFIFKFSNFNNILKQLFDSRCKYSDISICLAFHFFVCTSFNHILANFEKKLAVLAVLPSWQHFSTVHTFDMSACRTDSATNKNIFLAPSPMFSPFAIGIN